MSNIFSFLKESTSKYPNKQYVIDKEKKYTYSEIYKKVNILAGLLFESGVKSGDRVFLYLDNSAQYIAAYFAILRCNAIIVPINKNASIDSIQYIIEDTLPICIISNEVFMLRLKGGINLNEMKVIDMDKVWESEKLHTEELSGRLLEDDDRPALLLYTSGTTRMPKGVTLTHKNLTANTVTIEDYLELTEADTLLLIIDFGNSYGNTLLLTHTKAGCEIIIENRVSYPFLILEQLYKTRATGFSTVGSHINILLKQEGLKDFHFKNLRYITFAGESTDFKDIQTIKELAPNLKVCVVYGQTEASPVLSYLESDLVLTKMGSIGKGIPGSELKVVTEDGMEAAAGEIGEIIAAGDNIMKEYWNNEEETRLVIKDGWLYTGDLAVKDEDGYIYFKGRKDDIIKYFGHRISPAEIEVAINSCNNVLESAVIGIEDHQGKKIKAVVVTKNGVACMEQINLHVRKLLPAFKRPHIIEFVEELPRTSNGKIKRSELRKRSLV